MAISFAYKLVIFSLVLKGIKRAKRQHSLLSNVSFTLCPEIRMFCPAPTIYYVLVSEKQTHTHRLFTQNVIIHEA